MRLDFSFFENKTTLELAKELLGKVLVFESEKGVLKGIINETEAYTEEDESCHAYGGKKTQRNEVMFRKAGHLYVYFTYGMYHCCNIVTGLENKGEAVLIRSVIPIEGKEIMIGNRNGNYKNVADGPGKLCQAYEFEREYNGVDMLENNSKIYLEDLGYIPKNVEQTKRVGISKAQELEWRFVCKKFE